MYQYTHSSLKSGTFLKSKFSCLHFFRTLIPEYCVEPTETVEVPDLKAAVILRCLYGKCKKQSCCNTQASSWEQTNQLKIRLSEAKTHLPVMLAMLNLTYVPVRSTLSYLTSGRENDCTCI